MPATSKDDPDERARLLAGESADDPTVWFERLYAAADVGEAVVPWDRGAPHRLLVEWAQRRRLDGDDRRALVVGSGLGDDAEFIAGFGYDTLAFDVAPTAVRAARRRFPNSPVEYVVADLLNPPSEWRQAFDLVVESLTVQSLPRSLRREATANVARFVAPGGKLVVVATARCDDGGPDEGPPWPLTRAEIEAFASDGLQAVQIEDLRDTAQPTIHRWRAEFRLPP